MRRNWPPAWRRRLRQLGRSRSEVQRTVIERERPRSPHYGANQRERRLMAIAPPLPHLRIIAWRTGSWRTTRRHSIWHLSRNGRELLCGRQIPKSARCCEANRTNEWLLLQDTCARCLAAYGQEE